MDGDISGLVGKAVLQEEHRNSNPSQAPQSTLCGQLCAQSSVRWKQGEDAGVVFLHLTPLLALAQAGLKQLSGACRTSVHSEALVGDWFAVESEGIELVFRVELIYLSVNFCVCMCV